MGQYWIPVNLDKKEFIDPHKLGAGLKLWEQLANHPGTAAALLILCAAMPEPRGGGDLHVEPGKVLDKVLGEKSPPDYPSIAKRTIGRWAGDRIALVGDYAEDTDLPRRFKASKIFHKCFGEIPRVIHRISVYKDITDDVCAVIEFELDGRFSGDGWRDFNREKG